MGISYSSPAVQVRSGAERATLVRRTYGLVFVSILVMMAGAAFGLSQPSLMSAVMAHPIITFFCTLIPLWMAMRAPRDYPRNLILTLLFTGIEGIWLSPLLYVYGRLYPGAITQAAVLTFTTFGVLTLYATLSKRDFSAWGSFFMIGLWVLIAAMILNIFLKSTAASLWLSAGTILVFGGLLVFDTWRILRSGAYGENDYVPAAVQIYLDLLNIFLAILNLLGGGRRR